MLREANFPRSIISFFTYSFKFRCLYFHKEDNWFDFRSPMNLPRTCPLSKFASAFYTAHIIREINNLPRSESTPTFLDSAHVPRCSGFKDTFFLIESSQTSLKESIAVLFRRAYELGFIFDFSKAAIFYLASNGIPRTNCFLDVKISRSVLSCEVETIPILKSDKLQLLQSFEERNSPEERPVFAHQKVRFSSWMTVYGAMLSCNHTQRSHYFLNKVKSYLKGLVAARQLDLQYFLQLVNNFCGKIIFHIQRCAVVIDWIEDFEVFVKELVRSSLGAAPQVSLERVLFPYKFGGLTVLPLEEFQAIAACELRDRLYQKCGILFNLHTGWFQSSLGMELETSPERFCQGKQNNRYLSRFLTKTVGTLPFHLLGYFSALKHQDVSIPLSRLDAWLLCYSTNPELFFRAVTQGQNKDHTTPVKHLSNRLLKEWMSITPLFSWEYMSDWQVACAAQSALGIAPFETFDPPLKLCPLCRNKWHMHHFEECEVTLQIRKHQHQEFVLLLSHFIASIPDSKVFICDRSDMKCRAKSIEDICGTRPEIRVTFSNVRLKHHHREFYIFGEAQHKHS
jgi:hypothetical protein